MQVFLGFLIVASLVALLIGIVRPQWVLPSRMKPTSLKAMGIYFVIVLVFAGVAPKSTSSTKQQTESPAHTEASITQTKAPVSEKPELTRIGPGSTVVVLDTVNKKDFTYKIHIRVCVHRG